MRMARPFSGPVGQAESLTRLFVYGHDHGLRRCEYWLPCKVQPSQAELLFEIHPRRYRDRNGSAQPDCQAKPQATPRSTHESTAGICPHNGQCRLAPELCADHTSDATSAEPEAYLHMDDRSRTTPVSSRSRHRRSFADENAPPKSRGWSVALICHPLGRFRLPRAVHSHIYMVLATKWR
jgi:hypothetical protein